MTRPTPHTHPTPIHALQVSPSILRWSALGAALLIAMTGCGDSSSDDTSSGGSGSSSSSTGEGGGGTGCDLAANTTETAVSSPSGCVVLDRDTSACEADRTAAGLTGFWLHFSCRVSLTKGATTVTANADGQPDYASNYFETGDACHEAYPEGKQNPNVIAAGNYAIEFQSTPNTTSGNMTGAIVGLAKNGVPIFSNFAAPGDDIFLEAETFDRCGGHPQQSGVYHYHSEPYALSYDDSSFIGVMRDGYPLYGRRDMDGSIPTVDEFGGHTAVTNESDGQAVYHYHTNEQTSSTPSSAGQKQWFLTTGMYRGSPAPCGGCM